MSMTPENRKTIVESVELGMPLDKVAPLVESTVRQVRAEMRADPKFGAQVKAAESRCMERCLKALEKCAQWQANTFLLESRWPGQFRRNRKLPEPVAQTPLPLNDERLGRLDAKDFSLLTYLWDKMNGRPAVLEIPDIPNLRNRRTPPLAR